MARFGRKHGPKWGGHIRAIQHSVVVPDHWNFFFGETGWHGRARGHARLCQISGLARVSVLSFLCSIWVVLWLGIVFRLFWGFFVD